MTSAPSTTGTASVVAPPRSQSPSDVTATKQSLQVYHCKYCHSYALLLDCALISQPQRRTDRAFAIHHHRVQQSRLTHSTITGVRRAAGIEKQYRWQCDQCGLLVAYQCKPFDTEKVNPATVLYVLDDALTTDDPRSTSSKRRGADDDSGAGTGSVNQMRRFYRLSKNTEDEAIIREIKQLTAKSKRQSRAQSPPSLLNAR